MIQRVSLVPRMLVAYQPLPFLKDCLTVSASCSLPNGTTNGDLEFKVAAIVSAGSKHLNKAASSRNLPEKKEV